LPVVVTASSKVFVCTGLLSMIFLPYL
jgi:hypothetical protein